MKPNVIIDQEVYRKIMHWVNKSHMEVSGLGMVRVEKDGILRVVSAMLLPQKNGSTHTDIEAEDVNKALFSLRESEGDLRFWWHSHVNMAVFWSGTDMDTIKKIGAGGWFLSTVFNKRNELRSAFYAVDGLKTPWGVSPHFIDELETTIQAETNPLAALWDKEYEDNVTSSYTPHTSHWGGLHQIGLGERHGQHGTISTVTDAKVRAALSAFDFSKKPPESRPESLPKRFYKAWKKQWRDAQPKTSIVPSDEYGFTLDERVIFAQEGWDQADIDEFVEDFTPDELVKLAQLQAIPSEIRFMMESKYTPEDILRLFFEANSPQSADDGSGMNYEGGLS
jgi:hypothetical protein